MCVRATISDTSYQPGLIGQGTPVLPEVFGAHSQAVLHMRWLARRHTHTSTRTHLSEGIIIHYPFKEKKIYHCNGTFSVKCHFSNAHGQLTGTGFFAVAPGLASMVGCVVLCHLHSSGMQQWQPGEWGETTTKYINKTKGRQRKQKRRKKKNPEVCRALTQYIPQVTTGCWVLMSQLSLNGEKQQSGWPRKKKKK